MRIYADTSAFIAWFHPDDVFAHLVAPWFQEKASEYCWNQVLRAEIRHNLRLTKTPYAGLAWHAYRAAENTRLLVMERQSLSDLFEDADDLSARLAPEVTAGTWDFVHVAAAIHSRAQCFVTCDEAQAKLAKAAGISQVKLFKE